MLVAAPGRATRALGVVRADAWWIYKIGPLLAVAWMEVSFHDISPGRAFLLTVLLLISAFGIAAFGHVVNDASDVEADVRAGKRNVLAAWPARARGALGIAMLGVGFAPWLVFDLPGRALVVLGCIAALLVIYAVPPFRLKERGLLGVMADAAYAHALPVSFILALFEGAALPRPFDVLWPVSILVWAFCFGIRGIIIHQLWDASSDRQAGVRTFVTAKGPEAARRLVERVVYPVELLALTVLAFVLLRLAPLPLVILIVYGLSWWIGRFVGVFPAGLSLHPAPGPDTEYVPLVSFYSVWPALAMAVALLAHDLAYAPLLVLQILLFPLLLRDHLTVTSHLLRGNATQIYWKMHNALRGRMRRSRKSSASGQPPVSTPAGEKKQQAGA